MIYIDTTSEKFRKYETYRKRIPSERDRAFIDFEYKLSEFINYTPSWWLALVRGADRISDMTDFELAVHGITRLIRSDEYEQGLEDIYLAAVYLAKIPQREARRLMFAATYLASHLEEQA